MEPIVIDTNCFLRLLLNDIPEQADEVEKLLLQAKKEEKKILVPQIVLFEIEFVLRKIYHFPKEEILEKIMSIITTSYIQVQNVDIFRKAIRIFENHNLSLADCFIFVYARENESELFTFDKDLQKLSAK